MMDGWMDRMNDGWTDKHVLWASPPRTGSGPSVTTGHAVRPLTVTLELPWRECSGTTEGDPLPSCTAAWRSVQGQLRECPLPQAQAGCPETRSPRSMQPGPFPSREWTAHCRVRLPHLQGHLRVPRLLEQKESQNWTGTRPREHPFLSLDNAGPAALSWGIFGCKAAVTPEVGISVVFGAQEAGPSTGPLPTETQPRRLLLPCTRLPGARGAAGACGHRIWAATSVSLSRCR